MKNKIVLLSIIIAAITATAFKIADSIIERLGMMQNAAQGNIVSNIVGSFSSDPMNAYDDGSDPTSNFQIPYVPKLSTVISGDKATAAKELCEYVKAFINSEAFITQYNAQRQSAMPLTDKGSSLSSLLKDKIVIQKNINNYKTDTKYVAEQQKELDAYQKRIDALMEAAKKPFPGKAEWEKKYPVDPSALVKKRLEEYLQLAATVDFNAALTEPDKYKVKKFVNPAFEKKNYKWKAIYRAGKEVNDVVIVFVKEWLKGQIIASNKTNIAEKGITTKANTSTNTTNNNDKPAETIKATSTENQNKDAVNSSTTINNPKTDSTKTKKQLIKKVKGKIGF